MSEKIQKLKDRQLGKLRKELREAIIDGYPSSKELEIAINDNLNENLNKISEEKNLNYVVNDLITWANSRGRLEKLILALSYEKPDNKQLEAIKNKLLKVLSETGKMHSSVSETGNLESKNKQSIFSIFLEKKKLLLMNILGVTFAVSILRLSAILEPLELWFFDQMIGLQLYTLPPKEKQDENLLLIQITPEDIKKYGAGKGASLSDETLSKLVRKLIGDGAKVVGLDLYRDLNANKEDSINKNSNDKDSSNKDPSLNQLLKKTPGLFTICKVPDPKYNSQGTTPPSGVPNSKIGFSDLLDDVDGAVRRQLLRMDANNYNFKCTAEDKIMDSFSWKVAQHYLTAKGKQYKQNGKNNFASGDVVLERLHSLATGGYQSMERLQGYQVLLNYRYVCLSDKSPLPDCSTLKIAPTINVQRALTDNIKKLVKDKIVLIGTSIEDIDTESGTPFSRVGKDPPMPGLIMQAQMVSQLVNAAEKGRPLLRVWLIQHEILWILVWSITGSILAVKLRESTRNFIIYQAAAFTSLYVVCFMVLTSPIKLWIPFVPPSLTLTVTGVVVFINLKRDNSSSYIK